MLHQRRPPPLELLDRLGLLLDRLGEELDEDEDGRDTPCDGLLDRLLTEPLELEGPDPVDGFVVVDEPELELPEL